MKKSIIPFLLILFCAFSITIAKNPAGDSDLLNKLLKVSGVEEQSQAMPAELLAGMEQMFTKTGKDVTGMFDKEKITTEVTKIIKTEFTENLTDDQMGQIIDWFESKSGQNVRQAEESMDAAPATPDDEKKALIKKLVEETDFSKFNETISMHLSEKMMKTVMYASAAVMGKSKEDIDKMVEGAEFKEGVKKRVASEFSVEKFYAKYGSLDNEEITAYTTFLNSDAGKSFFKAATEGMIKSINYIFDTIDKKTK